MTRIFLASSKELEHDRRCFEQDIGRRNQRWSSDGYQLHMMLWEDLDDAMSPTRKQDDYNAAIAEADLFVLLVHTRVGPYTLEEFETAYELLQRTGKPRIYTYFKEMPEPGETDPGAEYGSVRALLARLAALQHWPNRYEEVSELLLHFGAQLDRLRAKGQLERVGAAVARHPELNDHAISALESYLQTLAADVSGLRLAEVDDSTDRTQLGPLELADVYVPLDTTCDIPTRMTLAGYLGAEGVKDWNRLDPTVTRAVTAVEALCAHRQVILLGRPGSGKSTFGAFVLLALVEARLGRASLAERLGDGWSLGPLLPIRIVLREFAEHCANEKRALDAGDLWDFVGHDLKRRGWGDASGAIAAMQTLARKDGAFVLFDGLDECGDDLQRARVLAAVERFQATAGVRSRFLLTARPYAFATGADPRRGIYQLADLDDPKIERFISGWYDAVVAKGWESAVDARGKCRDLLAAYRRPDLRQLAGNPLLATLMTTLHSNRGRLPDDRADLYEDTVTLLLMRWNRVVGADRALLDTLGVPGVTLVQFRVALQRLAFEAHEASEGSVVLADITQSKLLRAFEALADGSLDKARDIVAFIERRAGLLVGLGAGEDGEPLFAFPHRTFQEFLAACHLKDQRDFSAVCKRLGDRAPQHWREVLVLSARLAGPERGAAAALELTGPCDAGGGEPVSWKRVQMAAWMLCEIGARALAHSEFTRLVGGHVRRWLVLGLQAASECDSLGDALSSLGDPRFDERRCFLPADDPMLGFVRVPAIPGFAIGKFEVTVSQYQSYVLATGRKPGDARALRDPGSRPVRWVSWDEALAYADWLLQMLRDDASLKDTEAGRLVREQGWRVGLPSTHEWALAAQGGSPDDQAVPAGRRGADRQITSGILAVGCFPANALGIHDMVGDVWEWTRSVDLASYEDSYRAPREVNETEDPDNRHVISLRGGHDGRPRSNRGSVPWARWGDTGCRLVLRPPSVAGRSRDAAEVGED